MSRADAGLDASIGMLFGAGVRAASCSTDTERLEALLPAEAALAARFGARRRREFAAGRACARRLLADLGVPAVSLEMDAHRAPRWPAGVVGSISHGAGLCIVAVAPRHEFVGLGVDVESDEPLRDGVQRRVCTQSERRRLAELPASEQGRLAKLLFSIKESIYKCVHPLVGVPIGFQQADVRFDLATGRYSVTPIGARPEVAMRLAAVEGGFLWREGRVFSSASLRSERREIRGS